MADEKPREHKDGNWKKYDYKVTEAYCKKHTIGMTSLLYSLAVDPPEDTRLHFEQLDALQAEFNEYGTLYGKKVEV